MTYDDSRSRGGKRRGHFYELLKMEWKLSLREPGGLLVGLILPIALLIVFGLISRVSGGIGGLTVLQLWLPTIIVISLLSIALYSIPINLVRDRELGWLRRISTTPVSPARLLAAQEIINVVIAAIAIAVVIIGSEYIFGASLHIGIFYFLLSLSLATWIMISLGLLVAALAPSQRTCQGIVGGLFFPLLFLAGLWISPDQVGNPLRSIMWYSPVGAAARSLLYSIFNSPPPYTELLAMVVYAAVFSYLAVRFFRWE